MATISWEEERLIAIEHGSTKVCLDPGWIYSREQWVNCLSGGRPLLFEKYRNVYAFVGVQDGIFTYDMTWIGLNFDTYISLSFEMTDDVRDQFHRVLDMLFAPQKITPLLPPHN